MKYITLSEARASLCSIVETIRRGGKGVILSKYGRALAKIVPVSATDNPNEENLCDNTEEPPAPYETDCTPKSVSESIWAMQDAKARFSALADRASREGPQFVTKRGTPSIVVLSYEEYQTRLRRNHRTEWANFFSEGTAPEFELDRSAAQTIQHRELFP